MAEQKKSRRRTKKRAGRGSTDPFGLEGSDLERHPIPIDQVPVWFQEIRDTLCARWDSVRVSQLEGDLPKRLGEELGKAMTPKEANQWFKEARQDHLWRVHLLDPDTVEGRMYHTFAHLVTYDEYFESAGGSVGRIRELLLHVLDLAEAPRPFVPPRLRQVAIVPGDTIRRPKSRWKKDGRVMLLPIQGVEVPRRFGKVRASREVQKFLDYRSDQYWKDVLTYLKSQTDAAILPYEKSYEEEDLKRVFGESSAKLARGLRRPLTQLSRSLAGRGDVLTAAEVSEAAVLYKKWFPLVQRLLKARSKDLTIRSIPEDVKVLFAEAKYPTLQAQPITLQMVIKRLELPCEVETLRKKVRGHGSRRRTRP